MLDELGNPLNEFWVAVMATQMGKSLMLQISQAYKMKEQPSPMLFVTDTKDNAAKYSRERLDTMIRDNELLKRIIEDTKGRKADTILLKKYLGGYLRLVGANSPSGLISSTIKDLYLDEVDAYKLSAGQMGDPIQLAIRRTSEYDNRQICMTTSPGDEGSSRIWPYFENTDQRYFRVPCTHCDEGQPLLWGGPEVDYGMKWQNDDPSTAHYLCVHCHKKIYNIDKYKFLPQGQWKKTFPERINKPGFHINKLYSLSETAKWEKLVEEWLQAVRSQRQGDSHHVKVFINTVRAELYKPSFGLPPQEKLLERVKDYYSPQLKSILQKVVFVTAGIDTQDNRLEMAVKGWCVGEESILLRYEVFEGNPALEFVWNTLDYALMEPFNHPLGFPLYISAVAIDTGGHQTDHVYSFVRDRLARRLKSGVVQRFYATKGANTSGKPIIPNKPSFNNKGNIPLYFIGTDTAKQVIMDRLKIEWNKEIKAEEPHPGYMHFHSCADITYIQGLLSEKKVLKRVNGLHIPVWEPVPGQANEPLDCEVENLFAFRISKANLIKMNESMKELSTRLAQGTLFDKSKEEEKGTHKENDGWVNKWKK